jgi:hypothetical protein
LNPYVERVIGSIRRECRRAPAGINLQMLMDGRLALPLDWKDQQLTLQRRRGGLMFGGRRFNGEIGADIGEGARVTSPRNGLPHQVGQRQLGVLSAGVAQVLFNELPEAQPFIQLPHQGQAAIGSHPARAAAFAWDFEKEEFAERKLTIE